MLLITLAKNYRQYNKLITIHTSQDTMHQVKKKHIKLILQQAMARHWSNEPCEFHHHWQLKNTFQYEIPIEMIKQ